MPYVCPNLSDLWILTLLQVSHAGFGYWSESVLDCRAYAFDKPSYFKVFNEAEGGSSSTQFSESWVSYQIISGDAIKKVLQKIHTKALHLFTLCLNCARRACSICLPHPDYVPL